MKIKYKIEIEENRRQNITCTQDTDVMTALQGDKGEGSLLAGKPDDFQMS